MSELIERQAAIDALDFEIVHITAYRDGKNEGNPLAQYNKGLEDGKKAIEALPPVQPEYEEVTPEKAASEIASGSMMSAWSWLNVMTQLKQMGYAICRKR